MKVQLFSVLTVLVLLVASLGICYAQAAPAAPAASCTPCPPQAPALPVCAGIYGGIGYIPGDPTTMLTVTSRTPSAMATPMSCPSGAGPMACPATTSCDTCTSCATVSCTAAKPCSCPKVECPKPCPAQCPPTTCPTDPCPTNTCAPAPCPAPCPQPACVTTTTCVPAGPGAGPCAIPAIGGPSACVQQTIACMQSVSGVEVDKAYLQAMIQLNLSGLSVSDAAAVHLGTTSLQDFATNAIADARSDVRKSQDWLASKYCLTVTACAPSLGAGFDICAPRRTSKELDDAYRSQMVQFYLDEIALSQVMVQRGLDCDVKKYAAESIRHDQKRIAMLRRCSACGE
jgi:uncharacterized protein (DUF305 family)